MRDDKLIFTLESKGQGIDCKTTTELSNDFTIQDLLHTFYGSCITMTYSPLSILEEMQKFASERLMYFKK